MKTDENTLIGSSHTAVEESPRSNDLNSWPDAWLLDAVRQEPPDESALNALVERYWASVFGRCQLLTLNHEKARDLAQATWCRLLRSRQTLKADGHFLGYLTTIATNLYRDSYRAARRAGPMADYRLESLDAPPSLDDDQGHALVDIVPDLKSLHASEQTQLKMDIDAALERLDPLLREVLVARYISGESCAEIGQRHERTEQTVSAWVREGIRQMKLHLEDIPRV